MPSEQSLDYKQNGSSAVLCQDGCAGDTHHDHHDHSHHHENHWFKAGLGLLFGVGLLVLSLTGFTIPLVATYVLTGLNVLLTLYLGRNTYLSAWKAMREKKWNMASLYAVSTLTIVVVSILNLFIPSLPMMIEGAPLILGFWHLGEGIEHTLVAKIENKLEVLDCIAPLVLRKGNPDKEVPVTELKIGDVICLKKGATIPVDGVITEDAYLDTKVYNGKFDPILFNSGSEVHSGMRLVPPIDTDTVHITVKKNFNDSYLSIVSRNIKNAQKEKAPIELLANTVLKYFIPALILVSIISGVLIGSFFGPALAIQCIVSVLVSACPCALSLITPLAVKIGMNKAAEEGIHFKNGKELQAAADIDTFVFDLNGTLTEGASKVTKLTIGNQDDKSYLNYFALLEQQSTHPWAIVIRNHIKSSMPDESEDSLLITDVCQHPSGITARINNMRFMIGNKTMLINNGINDFNAPYGDPENGSIYMVCEEKIIGQISLSDSLREDALATVNKLKRLGKNIHICTGSDKAFAEKYAKNLGIPIENICYDAQSATNSNPSKQSKASYIKQLKSTGAKVAMIGDAVNDIEAFICSDIGIVIASNDNKDIQKAAGIVVQKGLLFPIVTAFDVAKKTKQNIFQNLSVSLTYNSVITLVAAGLFISLGFVLNPVLGVALMVVESAVILMNLYRLKIQSIESTASQKKVVNPSEHSTATMINSLKCYKYGELISEKVQPTVVMQPLQSRTCAEGSAHQEYPTLIPQYHGHIGPIIDLNAPDGIGIASI